MIYATLAYVGEDSENLTVDACFQVLPNKGDLISFSGSGQNINGKVKEIKHLAKNAVEPANICIKVEPDRGLPQRTAAEGS